MSVSKDKIKFAAYLHPETLDKIKELYRGDDCSSKSEFIEKAVRFYIGYLTAEDKSNYLPNMFLSNMRAIASESDNRVSRMLFKLAVEQAMMMNIMAANYDIEPGTLSRLRGSCVEEVKRLGGSFSMVSTQAAALDG